MRGHYAEFLAVIFLFLKGYFPLGRRVLTKCGEIDLIAMSFWPLRFRHILVVEVKFRQHLEDGLASVNPDKIERMKKAFALWQAMHLKQSEQNIQCRFDVIVVTPRSMPYHIKNITI